MYRPEPAPPLPPCTAAGTEGCLPRGGARSERNATNFPRALAGHCSCPPAFQGELAPCRPGVQGRLRAWARSLPSC